MSHSQIANCRGRRYPKGGSMFFPAYFPLQWMHKLPDTLTKITELVFSSQWRTEWPKNKCKGSESSEKSGLSCMTCPCGSITHGTKIQLMNFLWGVYYLSITCCHYSKMRLRGWGLGSLWGQKIVKHVLNISITVWCSLSLSLWNMEVLLMFEIHNSFTEIKNA